MMLLLKKFWPYILAVILVVVALVWWNRFISGVEAKGYTHGYDKATAEATAAKLVQAEVNQKAFAALIADKDAKNALLSASDDKHSKALRTSQNETARLRDSLASGTVGLYVNATCPQSQPRLGPQTTSNSSVDIGTGARLDKVAERSYNALRDGINQATAQLAACQGELKIRQDILASPVSP